MRERGRDKRWAEKSGRQREGEIGVGGRGRGMKKV